LVEVIYTLANGKISVPPDYKYLTSQYRENSAMLVSYREIEIINLIGNGLTTTNIATKLSITENTVENYRKRIFHKLNVKNVVQIIEEVSLLGYLK
jgi:DNA-binding NarL/FixJ family response regulator